MAGIPKVSPKLREIIEAGLFERLPPTFSTYFYDRIKDWKQLFPAEKDYFERLFALLDRSDSAAVEELFDPLRAVEEKMGVDKSTWPTREFTLQHVDFLERSPYLSEWRQVIADIFSKIDPLLDEQVARSGRPRLVVIISPAELPMGAGRMWLRIKEHGKLVPLAVDEQMPLDDYLPTLLTGAPRDELAPTLIDLYGDSQTESPYDCWLVEADDQIHRLTRSLGDWVGLSYERLERVRQVVMKKVDRMVQHQRIEGPQQLGRRLRKIQPKALKRAAGRDPVMSDFLHSVLLNGNGTLLINNTFVEWSTIQAIRRARPGLVVTAFGIRNKVKPFSSLLIYSDQEKTNPIPTQSDMLGTYVDLEVFYQYVWQECEKYPEYRRNTAYLFVGEGMDALLTIAPPDFPLLQADQPVRLSEVFAEAKRWLHL